MSDQLICEPVLDTAKEPAKLWRNWWIGYGPGAHKPARVVCATCRAVRIFPPGEAWRAHCKAYPTQDAAETAAKASRGRPRRPRWIGALPDGERPAFW